MRCTRLIDKEATHPAPCRWAGGGGDRLHRLGRSGRGRCVSIFLDKNRRRIGKSQSKNGRQKGRNGRRTVPRCSSSTSSCLANSSSSRVSVCSCWRSTSYLPDTTPAFATGASLRIAAHPLQHANPMDPPHDLFLSPAPHSGRQNEGPRRHEIQAAACPQQSLTCVAALP
jgi:hypothetical protein